MKSWQKLSLQSFLELALLLILHACLIRYLAQTNAVSTIFAAGDAVPRGTVALAIGFVLIRLLTVLALPGMILVRIGMILWEYFLNSQDHR